MNSKFRISSLILAGVLFFGCATSNYQKAGDTSMSLRDTAQSIDKTLVPLDAVTLALSDLIYLPKGDRAQQFRVFSRSLDALEARATEMGTLATTLQASGAEYLKQWDEELAMIENDDIQNRSEDRKNVVAARMKTVRENYLRTNAKLSPFLSNLRDLRTALATDLTAGGIDSIRGLEKTVTTDANQLRTSLTQLSADFRSLGVSLSSKTAV